MHTQAAGQRTAHDRQVLGDTSGLSLSRLCLRLFIWERFRVGFLRQAGTNIQTQITYIYLQSFFRLAAAHALPPERGKYLLS